MSRIELPYPIGVIEYMPDDSEEWRELTHCDGAKWYGYDEDGEKVEIRNTFKIREDFAHWLEEVAEQTLPMMKRERE